MTEGSGFFAEVDELTLARARRGDPEALELLYATFARPVYTLGCRLTGGAESAEDILQETFLELLRSLPGYRGEGAFGSWLRRIAVSKVLMRRRRARVRSVEAPQEVADAPGAWSPAPDRRWQLRFDLERALARLPEAARVVVWLHDVEGMTHAEIAEAFDKTESFSKSQLARAHDRLRQWLIDERSIEHASVDRRAAGVARR
jgi:RNA polymerase sigma-70 factor (ECF subfamily)